MCGGLDETRDFLHMLRIIGYSPKVCTKILNEGYTKILDLSEVTEDHFVRTLEKCAKQHKKVSFPPAPSLNYRSRIFIVLLLGAMGVYPARRK